MLAAARGGRQLPRPEQLNVARRTLAFSLRGSRGRQQHLFAHDGGVALGDRINPTGMPGGQASWSAKRPRNMRQSRRRRSRHACAPCAGRSADRPCACRPAHGAVSRCECGRQNARDRLKRAATRYRRRESSVEEALIEMYLAGISVRVRSSIQIRAEADRVFAIPFRRNVCPCSLLTDKLPDPVRIISAICE